MKVIDRNEKECILNIIQVVAKSMFPEGKSQWIFKRLSIALKMEMYIYGELAPENDVSEPHQL